MSTVRIQCTGGMCRVEDRLPSVLIRDLSNKCSYKLDGYIFTDAYRQGHWDGTKKLFHKGRRTFPIGLLPIVQGRIEDDGHEVLVSYAPQNLPSIKLDLSGFSARPYQEEATKRAVEERIGIVRMATGGGKTVVAGHIINVLKLPTLFLVHTKDLLYQAVDMFSEMFGEGKVARIGDGQVDVKEITVATIQSMARILEVGYQDYDEEEKWDDSDTIIDAPKSRWIVNCLNHVGVVFMDECHRVAAPTAMDVMGALINPKWRIGLSASPWRDDGADLAIQGCLGPIVFSMNASELTEQGYLVPAIIRMLEVPPEHFARGTTYNTVYSRYISGNDERNSMVVDAVQSLVRRQKPTMVLVRHIKHGELLQKQISEALGVWVPFLSGRDAGFVRKEVLDDMRAGKLGCLVASTIADEGLDLKPLQGLVLAGGGKSSVKALQRVGRTLRPFDGKENAEIVDFSDNARFLKKHSAARLKLYETEDAWTITDI